MSTRSLGECRDSGTPTGGTIPTLCAASSSNNDNHSYINLNPKPNALVSKLSLLYSPKLNPIWDIFFELLSSGAMRSREAYTGRGLRFRIRAWRGHVKT